MSPSPMKVKCQRCGNEGEIQMLDGVPAPPEGWQGSINEDAPDGYGPICPGCQYAEWHPHCTSLVDRDGERVDLSVIPREEWDPNTVFRCEYIDLSVSWVDDADWPDEWRCPKCGGTEFEGVHRDYAPSGIQPGSFTAELRDPRDED